MMAQIKITLNQDNTSAIEFWKDVIHLCIKQKSNHYNFICTSSNQTMCLRYGICKLKTI